MIGGRYAVWPNKAIERVRERLRHTHTHTHSACASEALDERLTGHTRRRSWVYEKTEEKNKQTTLWVFAIETAVSLSIVPCLLLFSIHLIITIRSLLTLSLASGWSFSCALKLSRRVTVMTKHDYNSRSRKVSTIARTQTDARRAS